MIDENFNMKSEVWNGTVEDKINQDRLFKHHISWKAVLFFLKAPDRFEQTTVLTCPTCDGGN